MPSTPIYEERLGANNLLIAGVSLWALAIGLAPGIMLGGWGIRKGGDGTFALTQAFINQAIKLETVDQIFVISSRKAEALCQAIKSVRG